jgi:hypothetical protein
VEKFNVEAKGSILSLPIEKSVQFEYKLETDLSFSLYRKSPLINISTGVGPIDQLISDKVKLKLKDFLVPVKTSIALKGPQDRPEAFLKVVIQARVDSHHRFSEDPGRSGPYHAAPSRLAVTERILAAILATAASRPTRASKPR